MNYTEEMKRLKESDSYYKPREGENTITILEEPVESVYENKLTGEKQAQWRMVVQPKGSSERLYWTIARSQNANSLRGQLVKLAVENGNKLVGLPIILQAVGNGKQRKYFVRRA